jgi:DNA invertase Pin-like site-specific DNA recombinase
MITATAPLKPKSPNGPLRVIIIGRVSTLHQDRENIPASYRVAERFLEQSYDGSVEIRHFGEQASGMLAERSTIVEAEDLISTGEWDLVIVEDLSRIYRNPRYQWAFVQDAVDHQTRVICIADNIDTADESWEIMMHAAALRHGLVVPDTRRRVRRTANHSFNNGGMVQKVRYGYRKLSKEEAASGEFGPTGLRLARLPECTPVIREMAARIMRGQTYDAVAEWLFEEGIEPGPYVKSQWTGRLVETLLRDPIVSGTRTYRDVLHEQIFKSGKHRRRRNPNGPDTKYYPQLAHLSAEEHSELLAIMDSRGANRDSRKGPDSPLWNRPRSRSFWPGQHARCGICGGMMYRYGAHLRCCNSVSQRGRTCWNHVNVDLATTRAKVLPWVLSVLNEHPGVRATVIQCAWQEFNRVSLSCTRWPGRSPSPSTMSCTTRAPGSPSSS